MSSDWPMKSVDQLKAAKKSAIAMGPFGSRIKVENFVSEGVPILKGGNLHGAYINDDKCDFLTEEKATELSSSVAVPGDIVITHRGTIGQVSIVPEDSRYPKYIVSQSQLKVSLNTSIINPLFANYYLRSRDGQHQLLSFSSQVGVPAIAKASSSVKQIRIPCPPLRVQKNIVIVLKTLDDKIQLNQQINQTLEQMAQAIFKSWFIDFDPVKAKTAALEAGGSEDDALLAAMQAIAGSALFATDAADADAPTQLARLQTEHPEQYTTLRATAELFPSAMQESELGEIPEGWSVGTLADFSDLNKNSWTAKTIPEEIDYVDLANTKNGVIECTTRYLSGDAPSRARRKLFNGDTIIGTVRPGNRSFAFIKQPSSSLTGSTGFAVLSPKSPEFAEYIYIAATSDEAINHLAHLADGGAYPAVRSEVVAGITAVVPKSPVLMCFHEMVRPYFDISASLKTGNKTLAELRDTLLPKLLSGEIDVSALADNTEANA